MFCGKCGNPIKDDQQFCTKCGMRVVSAGGQAPTAETPTAGLPADDAQVDEVAVAGTPTVEAPVAGTPTADAQLADARSADAPTQAITDGASPTAVITGDSQPTECIPGSEAPIASMATMPVNTEGLPGLDILVGYDEEFQAAAYMPAAGFASQGAQAPQVQQPHAPEWPQPESVVQEDAAGQGKSKAKTVAIVLCIAAVIAIAAVVAVVMSGLIPGTAPEAQGSEPTKCTHITRIHPKDANGRTLTDYTVDIVDKKTGEIIASTKGDKDKGFSIADAEADGTKIPDGEYVARVHDNETNTDIDYPIDVREDDPDIPDEVIVEPPSNTPPESDPDEGEEAPSEPSPGDEPIDEPSDDPDPVDRDKLMAQKYLGVVNDLVEKHGKGSVSDPSPDRKIVSINGVGLVKLVDLDDDGEDELLVGYYDESRVNASYSAKASFNNPSGYVVEVWDFDGEEAKELYKHIANCTSDAFAFVDLAKDDRGYYLEMRGGDSKDGKTDSVTDITRFNDGEAIVVPFVVHDSGSTNPTYEVDGREVTKSEFDSLMAEAAKGSDPETYWFVHAASSSSGKSFGPEKIVEATEATVSELEAKAAGDEAATAEQPSTKITEQKAREIVGTDWGNVLYVYAEDFDNDGAVEAMVITGKATSFENEYEDGRLIFVTSSGDCYEPDFGTNFLGNRMNGLVRVGGYLLLSTEHDGHGSGTSSSVFAVKNGDIVQVSFGIDDTVGNYGDHPGQASAGYVNVFGPQGGHDYEWHEFTYDYATSTLVDQGVVDSPYGN